MSETPSRISLLSKDLAFISNFCFISLSVFMYVCVKESLCVSLAKGNKGSTRHCFVRVAWPLTRRRTRLQCSSPSPPVRFAFLLPMVDSFASSAIKYARTFASLVATLSCAFSHRMIMKFIFIHSCCIHNLIYAALILVFLINYAANFLTRAS